MPRWKARSLAAAFFPVAPPAARRRQASGDAKRTCDQQMNPEPIPIQLDRGRL
jgi:hypothetical protein